MKQFEAELLKDDWTRVRPEVEVKKVAIPEGQETYILCRTARKEKEQAIRNRFSSRMEKAAVSENLTERPPLRNFLHPLNREEPTLVTAIRLAGDERHRGGWSERDAEGVGLRLNWAGHGERLDEGVGIPGMSGLSAGDRRRAQAAQVVDQAQAGESQHDLCGLRKTGAQDARGV
jgi:hypothetical protein